MQRELELEQGHRFQDESGHCHHGFAPIRRRRSPTKIVLHPKLDWAVPDGTHLPDGRPIGWVNKDFQVPGQGEVCVDDGKPLWDACSASADHIPAPEEEKARRREGNRRECPRCAKIHDVDPDGVGQDKREKIGRWLRQAVLRRVRRDGLDLPRGIVDVLMAGHAHYRGGKVPNGNGRLDLSGHRMDLRHERIVSAVLSIPEPEVDLNKQECRDFLHTASRLAFERGMRGFVMVLHLKRCGEGKRGDQASDYTRRGPHVHVLGLARHTVSGRPTFRKPGPGAERDGTIPYVHGPKGWQPVRGERVPALGWIWKVLWTAVPLDFARHGTWHVWGRWGRKKEAQNRTLGEGAFQGWLRRRAIYLLHHVTFRSRRYELDRHKEDGRWVDKNVLVDGGSSTRTWHGTLHQSHWPKFAQKAGPETGEDLCGVCGAPVIEVVGLTLYDWELRVLGSPWHAFD